MNLFHGANMFLIEFRHSRKLVGVKAVTTCVVIASGESFPTGMIAIENSVCSVADNFSRREGRCRALRKVLDRCAPLRGYREDIWVQYHRDKHGTFFDPLVDDKGKLLIPAIRRATPAALTPESIAILKASGEAKRAARQKARGAA